MEMLISQLGNMPPEFGAHIGLVKAPLDAVADELHNWRKDHGFDPTKAADAST